MRVNCVITEVENWSPDMIPVAFDRKFDEKFDEIPHGIYIDLICLKLFNIGDGGLTQKRNNDHKWGHMGSRRAIFWHAP